MKFVKSFYSSIKLTDWRFVGSLSFDLLTGFFILGTIIIVACDPPQAKVGVAICKISLGMWSGYFLAKLMGRRSY